MGLNCSEQQKAAQPLCSSFFLGHCSSGIFPGCVGADRVKPHPLISSLCYKLRARAKFRLCCTNSDRGGWARVSLGTLQGRGSKGNVTVGEKQEGWKLEAKGRNSWKMIRVQGTNLLWAPCFSSNQLLGFFSLLPLHTLTFPCGWDSFKFIFLGLFGIWFCGFFSYLYPCFLFADFGNPPHLSVLNYSGPYRIQLHLLDFYFNTGNKCDSIINLIVYLEVFVSSSLMLISCLLKSFLLLIWQVSWEIAH